MTRSKAMLVVMLTSIGTTSLAHAETEDPAANCEARLPELEQSWEETKKNDLLLEIAACSETTGDDVHALSSLKRWLRDGGATALGDRRSEIEQRIANLEPRVARVTIVSEVAGLDLRIDGSCATDATTFDPTCTSEQSDRVLVANPGSRRLTVKHPGFRDIAHVLTLTPGADVRVILTATRFHEQVNPYRDSAWTAWAVTGGALAGATIVGIRTALDSDGLNSASGIATIAFGSVALIAAGVATYYTVRASRWRPAKDVATVVDVLGRGYRF